MPRNIDQRVEVLFPLDDPDMVRRIRDQVLAIYLADNVKSRRMLPSGAYVEKASAARERSASTPRNGCWRSAADRPPRPRASPGAAPWTENGGRHSADRRLALNADRGSVSACCSAASPKI